MTKKQFITKICVKGCLLLIAIAILSIFVSSFAPTITNDIALGQLDNDDASFAVMSLWNTVLKFIDICKLALTFCFVVSASTDTYIYFKSKREVNN